MGVIVASGEFRHGTATPTYLATPNRARVLASKMMVAAGAGVVFGIVASGVATGVGFAFIASKGFHSVVPASTLLRYGAGSALACGLFGAAGVALGSLVRNQVAAIVGVFAWGFVVENILAGVFPDQARYLPYTAAIMLGGRAPRGAAVLPFGYAALLVAGVALVLAVAARQISVPRDVA
jgi:hypothetical protein